MTPAEIYAALQREPFNLPMSEVARLTDRQIHELLTRPEDKDREIADDDEPAAVRHNLQTLGTALGMSQGAIDAQWEKVKAKRGW